MYPSLGFLGFVLGIWAFGKVLLLGFRLNALGNWNGANFAPVSLLYFKSPGVDRIKIPGGAASRSRMYSPIPNIKYMYSKYDFHANSTRGLQRQSGQGCTLQSNLILWGVRKSLMHEFLFRYCIENSYSNANTVQ